MRKVRSAFVAGLGLSPPEIGSSDPKAPLDATHSRSMLAVSRPASPPHRHKEPLSWSVSSPPARLSRQLPAAEDLEAGFYVTYNEVKSSGFQMARRSWMALLYAILAMATHIMAEDGTPRDQKLAESDMFLRRAKELSLSDTLVGAGVETGAASMTSSVATWLTTSWNSTGVASYKSSSTRDSAISTDMVHSRLSCQVGIATWTSL
jgi:hypothetical protein